MKLYYSTADKGRKIIRDDEKVPDGWTSVAPNDESDLWQNGAWVPNIPALKNFALVRIASDTSKAMQAAAVAATAFDPTILPILIAEAAASTAPTPLIDALIAAGATSQAKADLIASLNTSASAFYTAAAAIAAKAATRTAAVAAATTPALIAAT